MPYTILEDDHLIEVHVTGEVTTPEILGALRKLQEADPRKERSDLWLLAPETMLPYEAFPTLIEAVKSLCVDDMVGRPSAVVTSDRMHAAALEIYRQEANQGKLPFDIRVFADRDSALEWLGN